MLAFPSARFLGVVGDTRPQIFDSFRSLAPDVSTVSTENVLNRLCFMKAVQTSTSRWQTADDVQSSKLCKHKNMWGSTFSVDSRRNCFITVPQKWGIDLGKVICFYSTENCKLKIVRSTSLHGIRRCRSSKFNRQIAPIPTLFTQQ